MPERVSRHTRPVTQAWEAQPGHLSKLLTDKHAATGLTQFSSVTNVSGWAQCLEVWSA